MLLAAKEEGGKARDLRGRVGRKGEKGEGKREGGRNKHEMMILLLALALGRGTEKVERRELRAQP